MPSSYTAVYTCIYLYVLHRIILTPTALSRHCMPYYYIPMRGRGIEMLPVLKLQSLSMAQINNSRDAAGTCL